MNLSKEYKIARIAYVSRLAVILIQYISNHLLDDHNAEVFMYPLTSEGRKTIIDRSIDHLFGGFVRWDAQYFMLIGKFGYVYENALAFFPGYPLVANILSNCVLLIFPDITMDSILLLVYIGFNFYVFKCSAVILYKLGLLFVNSKISYIAAILFCVNPASVFFSAPYSECLFSYLTFQSIYVCTELFNKYSEKGKVYTADLADVLKLLPIMLSTIVRSNGVLNVGFLFYTFVCLYFKLTPSIRRRYSIQWGLVTITVCGSCMLPFICYQKFCYDLFCVDQVYDIPPSIRAQAKFNNYVLPGESRLIKDSWCYDFVPLAYKYVQSHYWNVGFLKYYQLKQIPNFLLATPVLYILVKNCLKHAKLNFQGKSIWSIFTLENKPNKNRKYQDSMLFVPKMNVFVVHALFLCTSCILFIHIQVSTRLICSSTPLFYWYCASYLTKEDSIFSKPKSKKAALIKIYFCSYLFIGTVLFVNFYPWT